MRDHGGNLDDAIRRHGGAPGDWIDLSTGINRVPWPVPGLPASVWTDLPTRASMQRLAEAARQAFGATGDVVPLAGASQAIQLIPLMGRPGRARVLAPTYNEHASALRAAGWQVEEVGAPELLAGSDIAVVVNPNNPTGRRLTAGSLLDLRAQVGLLVVDESFADARPEGSLAAETHGEGLVVLRSFGKFHGLAGLRLGFAIGAPGTAARLAELAGPWPVSGPAIAIGMAAFADRDWHRTTRERLRQDARRLDALSLWPCAGGTELFRLYDTPDAGAAQEALARHRIWSRIFPWSGRYLRLGLPGAAEWDRVAAALAAV